MDEGTEKGIPALLAELDRPVDDEHPDVSVTDDGTAWSVAAFPSGGLVFENLDEDGEPRHMTDVPREGAIRVLTLLARGDLAALETLPWSPGYR
jgi:hypothetical protein